jgi:uncharacterized protein (DUF305 family)
MTSIMGRVAALVIAFVSALFLSSCGDSTSDDERAGRAESAAAEVEPANHNADDVAFAQNMIPHHQQAVEMSAMAQANSSSPPVRDLANAIIAAQMPEIQAFRAWLLQWDTPETPDHGAHGSGMVDQATIDRLATLRGPEFDRLWLAAMIAHHEGAIAMSEAEIAGGQNTDVISVANMIIADQQAEIDQMKQLLGG